MSAYKTLERLQGPFAAWWLSLSSDEKSDLLDKICIKSCCRKKPSECNCQKEIK